MNKKGIELSVGFIVILIFSILIFSLSVYLLFKWFGDVDKLSDQIDRQTQAEITTALKSGNRLVAIPFPVQTVKRGQSAVFGVGVRNPASAKKFSIAVDFSNAFNPDGSSMDRVDRDYTMRNWLGSFSQVEPFFVQKNSEAIKSLMIKVAEISPGVATLPGDYVFNVCVFVAPDDSEPAAASCDISSYTRNPAAFYSGRIYQVTVRVR